MTIEHPLASATRKTCPTRALRSYQDVVVDRCWTGLRAAKEDGCAASVRKQTRLRATSLSVAAAIWPFSQCIFDVPHVPTIGRSAELTAVRKTRSQTSCVELIRLDRRISRGSAKRHAMAMAIFAMDELGTSMPDSQQFMEAIMDFIRTLG